MTTMDCEDCGATWRRSARFCGRCGAVLPAAPRTAETPRRWPSPGLHRWVLAVTAASCLVVLGGVALFIGEPWERLQAPPSQDVEVPPSPEGTTPEDGRQPGVAWEPPAPAVLCQPAPCERWRMHLPTGTSVVEGDAVYHVGSTDWRTEVTAIELDTGAVRWRETMVVPDAVNGAPLDGPSPELLTGRDDVIIVASEGLLEARSHADGGVVWAVERAGLLPRSVELGPSDTILVFAGLRVVEDVHGPGRWSETILSLDATTGEPRWEREVTMPLIHDPLTDEVVLALVEPSEEASDPEVPTEDATLLALHPLTGETLWRHPMPRHGLGVAGSALRLHQDAHHELRDLRTGEPLELPVEIREPFDVEVYGDLVAVRSRPRDGEPREGSEEPLQHLVVLDRAEGAERFSASAPGWVGTQALPDGGMVIASGEGELLHLTALGPDGHTRWALRLGVPSATAWPRWPQVLDDGTVTIIASTEPGGPHLAAHRIDASTGDALGTFHLDVDGVEPHDLELRWPVVIDHRSDGAGMRLHGPAGSLEMPQHVQVLSVDPLVVRTPSGTVARLDEGILLART